MWWLRMTWWNLSSHPHWVVCTGSAVLSYLEAPFPAHWMTLSTEYDCTRPRHRTMSLIHISFRDLAWLASRNSPQGLISCFSYPSYTLMFYQVSRAGQTK